MSKTFTQGHSPGLMDCLEAGIGYRETELFHMHTLNIGVRGKGLQGGEPTSPPVLKYCIIQAINIPNDSGKNIT